MEGADITCPRPAVNAPFRVWRTGCIERPICQFRLIPPTLMARYPGQSMKLYDDNNPAPNPRKVRIYLAEKGIEVPRERVRIMKREHKSPEHLKRNTLGQLPVLELDDGSHISESVAICRYFEELHPSPPLFGRNAKERALVEMWTRRAEFRLWNPMSQVWIHADPRTAAVVPHQYKEFGEWNRKVVANAMAWLDREMADGREFLAGDFFSMADIVLLCGIDFAKFVNMDMPEEDAHLRRWHARVSARPSAAA
jgi:glutathione S-transferase